MRLLTWNIRAGGGTRITRLTAAIAAHDADVLVLTEYRSGEAGHGLRAALSAIGYTAQTRIEPPPPRNGVLIAARFPLPRATPLTQALPEPWRLLTLTLRGTRLFGVYMPNLKAKIPYWETLIQAARPHARRHALAIGDFNTCRAFVDEPGAIDKTAWCMDEIIAAGFRDVWRDRNPEGREFSWYSHRGNGFRIDHAFASPALARRVGVIRYAHADRAPGLSDHAPLILDIDGA